MTDHEAATPTTDEVGRLNGAYHRTALNLFMVIVIGHWAEHIAQAYQLWVLHWPGPKAGGVLGLWFPWLISSEWLHYGYALVMLIGLWILRGGFVGRARTWWMVAFAIQFWHHLEHLLLFVQAQTGVYLFDRPVPTSILQLLVPRAELHLFYNTIVFLPMVVGVFYHLRPNPAEARQMLCSCAGHTLAPATA